MVFSEGFEALQRAWPFPRQGNPAEPGSYITTRYGVRIPRECHPDSKVYELDEGVTALYCTAENRHEANNAKAVARWLLVYRAVINAHKATASSKKQAWPCFFPLTSCSFTKSFQIFSSALVVNLTSTINAQTLYDLRSEIHKPNPIIPATTSMSSVG